MQYGGNKIRQHSYVLATMANRDPPKCLLRVKGYYVSNVTLKLWAVLNGPLTQLWFLIYCANCTRWFSVTFCGIYVAPHNMDQLYFMFLQIKPRPQHDNFMKLNDSRRLLMIKHEIRGRLNHLTSCVMANVCKCMHVYPKASQFSIAKVFKLHWPIF